MSSEIQNNQKTKFHSPNTVDKKGNKTQINYYKDYSEDRIMQKEDIIENKLKFKRIFEKIFIKNKRKFNNTILSDFEKKKQNMEKLISIENLNNFGLPYNIEVKKDIKRNNSKKCNKNYDNLKRKKIKMGHMNYFNLETFNKENISRYILNRQNERILMRSKNFNSKMADVPMDMDIFSAKNILKSMNIIKNKTNSRLFDYEKRQSKMKTLNNNIKSLDNSCKKRKISKFDYNGKNKTIDSPNMKNRKIVNYKTLNEEKDLSNINILNKEKSIITNLIKEENSKKTLSEKNSPKFETFNKKENKLKGKIKEKISKKSIRKLILSNESKDETNNDLKDLKILIKDLRKYNKRDNFLNILDVNDKIFTKEEVMNLRNRQFKEISKNFGKVNNNIRKVINNYESLKNIKSYTDRNKNKNNNFKIIKMFSSLGKETINNMATDLGYCQNHINKQLIYHTDYSSYKKRFMKKVDPFKDIIPLNRKKKNHPKSLEYTIKDKYEEFHENEHQNKEVEKLGEIIEKLNYNVAPDLSNNLFSYNKQMGKKIEGTQNDEINKNINDIKISRNNLESNIYNLKRLKQRNIFEYNKIIHKFNEYYKKLHFENNISNIDKLFSLINS